MKLNSLNNFKFKGFNLPNSMDITTWGNIHFYSNYTKAIVFKYKSKGNYHITIMTNYIIVDLMVDNKIILQFKDTMLDVNNLNTFSREINNQKYIFKDGELILKQIIRKTKFISSVKPSIYLSDKFVTMDLETRNINGLITPYCICIYDGQKVSSFYLTDFQDYTLMLEKAVKSLMLRKYNGYRVYLHNFSNFDGIFLLKVLTNLSTDIKTIINDNKLINIKFKFTNYCLFFRDSYLLLPSSLNKLASAFKEEQKHIFPIFFVNDPNVQLNYVGSVPSIKYFKCDSEFKMENYLNYAQNFKDKVWDLKYEAIKYCSQDVIILYKVIEKFNNLIFDEIRLDIANYPTLPSLAFAIFRCRFLKNFKIPIITGSIFDFIKQSYTGGSVDVYRPLGVNLYHYDVNSLFPFVMLNFPVPVGNPTYFEGDIKQFSHKPFGFFEVKVKAPENLNIPLLQFRLKLDNGYKTISPVGEWKGVYFSEEIYKAEKLGYSFEILRGYTFDKEYIFKEYVEYFYDMKKKSEKNSPYYIIAKYLLNSLYGRLGMNPNIEKHIISNPNDLDYFDIFNNNTVTNVVNIDNGKDLISYLEGTSELEDNALSKDINVSVPIASAITSYSRIHMYQFKLNQYYKIYYTDTDSIAIDKKLDNNFISNELGKMKLEYISKKAIFLAPKVYFCDTNLGVICKIKGFQLNKDNNQLITFNDFEKLLFKNNHLSLEQNKWHKYIGQGYIIVNKEHYTLTLTSGKRELIFDSNNKFIDTRPINLREENGSYLIVNNT